MTWPEARQALIDVIESAGYEVYAVPPRSIQNAPDDVVVFMLPPARETIGRQGDLKQKVYSPRVNVINKLGQDEKTVAFAVDAAVEAIDDAMDGAIALGGAAVETKPFKWTEAQVADYPPRSGQQYIQQVGEMELTLEFQITVEY